MTMTRSSRRGDTCHMRNPTMCQRAPKLCTRRDLCVYVCSVLSASRSLSMSLYLTLALSLVAVARTISTALESRSPCPRLVPADPPDRIHPSDATPRLMMQTDHRQHTYTRSSGTSSSGSGSGSRLSARTRTEAQHADTVRHGCVRINTLPALCGLLRGLR